jgi:hypothetical protein
MNNTELVEKWHNGVRLLQVAHNMAASHYCRINRLLGIPVVVLSAIVVTSIFASLQSEVHIVMKVVVGMLSVCAAVLSGLQTFLRHAELAEKHRIAAGKFGELRREIQQVAAFPPKEEEKFAEFCESFRARWDEAEKESPTLQQKLHDAARSSLAG